jgi:lipopolysaccharide export system permease protein
MPLIGMPLGASFRTRGRNFGLFIGLIIFMLYYSVFTIGWTLGGALLIPPIIAGWSPVFLVLLAAIYFLKNFNHSATIDLSAFWKRIMHRFEAKRD